MKRKVIGIVAAVLVLAISISVLAACNNYKWDSIGAGDSSAATISNGGYYVQQGKYAYFINGYVGSVTENEFGVPVKQSLVRAEIAQDGSVNMNTAKVLVPLSIYNESAKGGIAVFGEWVYYATPNVDKDKNGTASTTDTNFMRTKTDGTITQLIGTISSRSSEYFFTPSRVIYYVDSTISYIDFSGMKTNKSIDNGKGAEKGEIASSVTSFTWKYDEKYEGAGIADTFYYTQTITGDDSYKNYNNLYACKVDGTKTLLATESTYLEAGQTYVTAPQSVFKFTLVDMFLEDDTTATIYYTKSYHVGDNDTVVGLFCNKFDYTNGFKTATEKKLNTIGSTTIYPLGYEEGALAYDSNSCYCLYKSADVAAVKVTNASETIYYVDADGYAYYGASSSPEMLYKIYYREAKDNAQEVVEATFKSDWLSLEFVGDMFIFFDGDDDTYLHEINYKTFDMTAEDAETLDMAYPIRPETEETEEE